MSQLDLNRALAHLWTFYEAQASRGILGKDFVSIRSRDCQRDDFRRIKILEIILYIYVVVVILH
jgi:hypothetical protein